MNKLIQNLDTLDDSSEDLYQEEELGEELFDGSLYSAEAQRNLRRGFVEDLEARVDESMARVEEQSLIHEILGTKQLEEIEDV